MGCIWARNKRVVEEVSTGMSSECGLVDISCISTIVVGWWTVGVWYVYGLWRRHRATILRGRVTRSVSVGGMEYALHRTEQLQWLWQYEVNSSWSIKFVLQNSPSQQPTQKIRLRRRERKCCPHATAKPEFYVGNNTTEIIATRRPHLQRMIWAKLALRRCTEGEASDVVRLKRRLFEERKKSATWN